MASNDVDFQALYQSSLKLTTSIGERGIPRLEKRLEQLDEASRSLYAQAPSSSRKRSAAASVNKANFLLAAKGIDAEKLNKELEQFEIAHEFEPETPLGDTDLEGYLAHHHEMIVLTAIEDVNRRTMETTHDRMNRAMIDDFEGAKQRLLEELGGAKELGIANYPRIQEDSADGSVFSSTAQEKRQAFEPHSGLGLTGASFVGQPHFELENGPSSLHVSQFQVENAMTEEMKQYYLVVRELNQSRVPSTRSQFELARQFERVCASNVSVSVSGSKWEIVLKCWQLVNDILAGGDSTQPNTRKVAEREFAAPRVEREEWFRESKEFAEKWMRFPWVQTVANKYAKTAAVAFETLLNISIFLEFFEKQQYEDAIGFVDEMEIIPTQHSSNLSLYVDRFLAFDESVRQKFHILLIGYMECLVRDADRLRTQLSGEVRRARVAALREKAELVVTFAGMIKFRLPTGTNERLNRMESMIY
ncbi:hypothetical protein PsorP6_008388 [Peronosclerospora sorghi]|uniref:Uncharacterized protein n=1 Tax=Peronosclerospora sorghi TaxID=230839 RepID=A0ACC0WAK8_9STRA|nr:hypothetical protein PsorP6_008388 [Peronosclerospora sorghi]